MKASDLSHFRCPACAVGELNIGSPAVAVATGDLREATLHCGACGAGYATRDGIPRFVSSENYAASFGYQWNKHQQTQLDSCSGMSLSSDRLFSVSGWPERMEGSRILEAGSGAGRFTEVLLKTGAEVYSFDYSSAVDANRQNNGTHQNLHLFQGDIFKIPLAPASFDKVICLGVLQHTPDPELAFQSLARFVRPGGELVVDVYRNNLASLLHWKYVLRPLTRRMDQQRLYQVIERVVPPLIPVSSFLRDRFGRAGMRLIPILQFAHWGLPPELNSKWAILDTFDMYSPAHDHPQSLKTVRAWYSRAGFAQTTVKPGPNGIVAKGVRARPGSPGKAPSQSKRY